MPEPMTPPTHPTADARPDGRTRAREAGWGVIEMMVVLLISVILLIIVVMNFTGARNSTAKNQARAVANSYSQAIAQFQTDNANRVPGAGDFAANGAGPLNLLGQPYLGSPPKGVGSTVELQGMAGPAAANGATVRVQYRAIGQADYEVIASWSDKGTWTELCRAGSTGAGEPC